jgi:hypothetical protein
MNDRYEIVGERNEQTWGWPFWLGTILGLVAGIWFCQRVMFDAVSVKSILGSSLVSLAPAILAGLLLQIMCSLFKGTVAGEFGVAAYLMISVALAVAVCIGLLFSRLSDRWQGRVGLVLDVLIGLGLLLEMRIIKRRRR